jgi:hypothetical protein
MRLTRRFRRRLPRRLGESISVVAGPCNDRNRIDWDHRPGMTSLGARLATTEPSMKPRGGSLAGRLLDRCITAELALNWPPDRAIELPCWTPAGPRLDPAGPPRWSPAGATLGPRWTPAGPLRMTSPARGLRPAHPARPGMRGAHRTTFENARGIGSPFPSVEANRRGAHHKAGGHRRA